MAKKHRPKRVSETPGEIPSTALRYPLVEEPPPSPVPNIIPMATVQYTQTSKVNSEFSQLIAKILKEGTASQQKVVSELERYIDKMSPGKPVTDAEGNEQQFRLWNTIYFIAEVAPVEDFQRLWTILTAYYREYKDGVFGPRYVNRFAHSWTGSPEQLASLQRINNLISTYIRLNGTTDILKLVDLNKTLADSFTEIGRGRIQSFYN